ncbi:hypothetical protein EG329_004871 [Mollisiaceae sp. DMI_Dod_QoI]|nr:hypothetical protein EG329_004871 [Helotiales sp. DMI_Dod_QoI]
MEPAPRRRVREFGTSRKPKPARSKSPRESPTPPPRNKGQRRRKQEAGKGQRLWKLGTPAILREEQRANGLYYLLNWANDAETGETYEPSWEPESFANKAAVEEWRQLKAERAQVHHTAPSLPDTQNSQESQPVRTAKRKREAPEEDSTPQGYPGTKKVRRAGTKDTARFQSASQESIALEGLPTEIQDTYAEDSVNSHVEGEPGVRVEIPELAGFDREAYVIAPASSQSSQLIQHTQDSTHSTATFSQSHTPLAKRLFIWDEDLEGTVPDSEGQPGSSSYRPSDTPTSRASVPARLDTETVTEQFSDELDFQARQSPVVSNRSGTVGSHLAETGSLLAGQSYRGTQLTSTQNESSIEDPPITQQSNSSWEDSHESESQGIELPSRQIDEATPPEDSVSHNHFTYQNSRHLNSANSQIVRSSSTPPESNLPDFNSSQGYQNSQNLPTTRLVYNVFTTCFDKSSNMKSSSKEIHISRVTSRESNSATLIQESLQRQSLPATEASLSSFEADWQASRVISSTPRPAQVSVVPPISVDLPAAREATYQTISPQEEIESIEHVSFCDLSAVNSQVPQSRSQGQTSPPKTPEEHRSQSSHLPSPPTEDILPSIEQAANASSSALARQGTPPSSDASSNSSPIQPVPSSNMEPGVTPERGGFDVKSAIKQRLEAKQAETKAKQAARANSSAPPLPAAVSQHASELNYTLPVQVTVQETDLTVDAPHLSIQPSLEVEQVSADVDVLPSQSDEFLVPLPMVAILRDIYMTTMEKKHKSLIETFVRDEVFEESQVSEIDSMLDELRKLCDHPDLIADDFSYQRLVEQWQQAKWALNVSTKCMFLGELLPRVQSLDLHILILVRPGRMTEILEAVLKHLEFAYTRADQQPWNGVPVHGLLRITLHPTGDQKFTCEEPTVVIAFDSTSKDFSFLRDVRSNPRRYTSGLAPLISLVVAQSIEHLERHFDDEVDPIQKKIKIVKGLRQLAGYVDCFKSDYPVSAGSAVAKYLEEGALAGSWPLLPMPEIDEFDFSPDSSQLESKEELDAELATQSYDMPPSQILHPGTKRQLANEDAMDTDSPKRQRLTPVPDEQAGEMDISHVSDSVVQPSSILPQSSAVPASSKVGAQGGDMDQVSLLLKKIKDLEIHLRSKEVSEAQLRQINNDLEARCQDFESSIANIQPKYQEALNDRGHFEYELTQTLTREAETRRRMDAKDVEITKLKEKNASIALELSAARQALATSTIPEVAEMASMKEEVTKTKAENERLQKRLANMQNDLEYMRTNYQNSSSIAAESASELRDLKSEIAELQAKADANTVRIHEIQRDEEISAHLATIKRLKAEKEDIEREYEKKSEELKAMLNGRRATRGTSVPRSPRMGGAGTMSPGPARNISRAFQMSAGGNGSRGNSPAPGGVLFGEPLGSARWRDHLQ